MRMNLHTLSKLGYILTFAVFLVIFAVTVIIGIFGTRPQKLLFCFLRRSLLPGRQIPLYYSAPSRKNWIALRFYAFGRQYSTRCDKRSGPVSQMMEVLTRPTLACYSGPAPWVYYPAEGGTDAMASNGVRPSSWPTRRLSRVFVCVLHSLASFVSHWNSYALSSDGRFVCCPFNSILTLLAALFLLLGPHSACVPQKTRLGRTLLEPPHHSRFPTRQLSQSTLLIPRNKLSSETGV